MANDYDAQAKNVMLNQLATVAVRWALHTDDPGAADTGDNEVTGGTPGYARGTVAWNAASTGTATQNGDVVIDVPACTVSWVSLWNAAGSVRYLKKDVTDEIFAGQGTYTIKGTTSTLDINDA